MINKIKSRLKFLHRKTTFLTPVLRRLICPALIQSHFDYASSVCFPNFSQKMKKKQKKNKSKQVTKNTCIRYCLQLDKMIHISKNEFETLKLPVKDRFSQSINSTISKCFTKTSPNYLNEVFELACPNKSRTRNACLILVCLLRKTNMRQEAIFFYRPSLWNKTIYGIPPTPK